jgi:DNA mismatch endonuclease (patch repair protein)
MQVTPRRDTPSELALRSELHRRGLRFRVDVAVLRGSRRRADIVFPRARVAVFCDGCFWHGCPQHATWPKANAQWWKEKIEKNRERDHNTNELLGNAGWLPIRVWEHEDVGEAADRVEREVRRRGWSHADTPS